MTREFESGDHFPKGVGRVNVETHTFHGGPQSAKFSDYTLRFNDVSIGRFSVGEKDNVGTLTWEGNVSYENIEKAAESFFGMVIGEPFLFDLTRERRISSQLRVAERQPHFVSYTQPSFNLNDPSEYEKYKQTLGARNSVEAVAYFLADPVNESTTAGISFDNPDVNQWHKNIGFTLVGDQQWSENIVSWVVNHHNKKTILQKKDVYKDITHTLAKLKAS